MNVRYLAGAAALGIAIPIVYASAQESPERDITLVGCVMRESVYRDTYGPGLSGPRGPGIGVRNEYMLVDAREIAPGETITGEVTACPGPGSTFPTAYELTGSREEEIAEYVGRRVVITGIQKEAKVRPVGTSGTLRPTGGFDPLGHEMHLFEVELNTFRDVNAVLAEARPAAPPAPAPAPVAEAPPAAPVAEVPPAPAPEAEVVERAPEPEPAPAPAPAPVAQAPQPEPAPQVAQAELPRTASPLPLAGLAGLLSFAAAAGIRRIRRRRVARSLMVVACLLALPALGAAQTTIPQPEPFPIESHWLASGSLGSDFEADAEDPSVNFAGSFGWLYRGVIGGEFQANFTPDFQLDAAFMPPFLAEEPAINSYMLNVIAAAPLMAGGQFQPYFSAGAGWFTMNADATAGDLDIDMDHTETGWNAGFGAMGFLGQLGVRADLRYFAVGGDEFQGVDGSVLRARHGAVVDDQEQFVNGNLLSGLSFWRGNVGVALRW
jgi:hypothetical protein